MKAGWKNTLKKETMLLSHTRSANFINRINRVSMHKLVDSKKANKQRLKEDEERVQDLANCFFEFERDPIDSMLTVGKTLLSGEIALVKLEKDFATVIHRVKNLLPIFLKYRFFQGIKNLMQPYTEIR